MWFYLFVAVKNPGWSTSLRSTVHVLKPTFNMILLLAKRFAFREKDLLRSVLTKVHENTAMLTLKYPSTQRGPTFIVQVEGSYNFLFNNPSVIAYRRSEKAVELDFWRVSVEQLQTLNFVLGKRLQVTNAPRYETTLRLSFEDEAVRLSATTHPSSSSHK